ncbi:GLPGLI family protein [Flavobacterium frigidarium]|uniref:GLPGLI family protein n=1 Tax=Flavobacterium frigidarium TaxID=99286 RepID=UPI0030D98302
MKNIIMLVFLFTYSFLFSQSNAGKIVYSIHISADEKVLKSEKVGKLYMDMSKNAADQMYVLSFKEGKSSFLKAEKLNAAKDKYEETVSKLASVIFTNDDNYYYDFVNRYAIIETNGALVKEAVKDVNWEMTSENKIISGILCYKSTRKLEYLGRDNKIKINNIVAWFAPSLPFSYGPKDFYGLPGLIVQLTENRTTYLANKIELDDLEISIDFPKGKTVSKEEFDKKLKAQMGM